MDDTLNIFQSENTITEDESESSVSVTKRFCVQLLESARVFGGQLFIKNINRHKPENRVRYILENKKLNKCYQFIYNELYKKYTRDHSKDLNKAREYRLKGNECIKRKDYELAVEYYSLAVCSSPQCDSLAVCSSPDHNCELSLSYANRSLGLYHLARYDKAILDIDDALKYHYPDDKKDKVYLRKAQCLNNIGKYEEAKTIIKQNILDRAQDFSHKSIKEVQQLYEKLSKNQSNLRPSQNQVNNLQHSQNEVNNLQHSQNEVQNEVQNQVQNQVNCNTMKNTIKYCFSPDESNPMIPCASKSVSMSYTEKKGRHIIANDNINQNDIIMIERPYASVLYHKYSNKYCQNCFSPLQGRSIPCTNCNDMRYCSLSCRDTAWHDYHTLECGRFLVFRELLGKYYLVIRILARVGIRNALTYANKHQPTINQHTHCLANDKHQPTINQHTHCHDTYSANDKHQPNTNQHTHCLANHNQPTINQHTHCPDTYSANHNQPTINQHTHCPDTYSAIFDLVCHYDQHYDTHSLDCLYALIAGILLVSLSEHGLLNDFSQQDYYKLGFIILKHIHQSKVNSIEIEEPEEVKQKSPDCTSLSLDCTSLSLDCTSLSPNKIGLGLYPTISLINHSCYANAFVEFNGNLMTVLSYKNNKKGEEINVCYGPSIFTMSRKDRQMILKQGFHFDCACQACVNGYENRQIALLCTNCNGPVIYNKDKTSECLDCEKNDSNIDAILCQVNKGIKHFNLGQSLSHNSDLGQSLSHNNDLGQSLSHNDQHSQALQAMTQALRIFEKTLYCQHEFLYKTNSVLVNIFKNLKQYDKAVEYCKKCIEYSNTIYDENSYETVQQLVSLISLKKEEILNQTNNTKKNQLLFNQILIIYEKIKSICEKSSTEEFKELLNHAVDLMKNLYSTVPYLKSKI